MMARCLGTLLCVIVLAGCYRTVDLPGQAPDPGTHIVAGLTPAGTVEMARWIGAEAISIEGRVMAVRREDWELSLLRVAHHRAASAEWAGERVVFPRELLRDVKQRRLDRLRTGTFAAALATSIVVLARSFMSSSGAGDNGGPGPAPPL